jgi:isocitrate lyase
MKVPGIIVSNRREAAALLDKEVMNGIILILGATKTDLPGYKNCYLAILKIFNEKGIKDVNGHFLYRISDFGI